jgi:hypothetical protein
MIIMENDRFMLIGVIVLLVAIFSAYIIVGTDVFAQNTISEQGATNIVNSTINNTTNMYPAEANNFQVSKPKRVKQNGIMVWIVPVKYIGLNEAIKSKFNGNIEIPTKGILDAKGNIKATGKMADNAPFDFTTDKKGLNAAVAPGTTIVPPPTIASKPAEKSTDQTSTPKASPSKKSTTKASPKGWAGQGSYDSNGNWGEN